VTTEADPGCGERIEVRRAHDRVAGRRQAIAAELVECDQQHVHGPLKLHTGDMT